MNIVHLIDCMEFMKTVPDKYYELRNSMGADIEWEVTLIQIKRTGIFCLQVKRMGDVTEARRMKLNKDREWEMLKE